MDSLGTWLQWGLVVLAILVLCGWIVRSATEPKRVLVKLIVTGLLLGSTPFTIWPVFTRSDPYTAAFGGVILTVIYAIVLYFLWREHIADVAGDWFGGLLTGGSTPPDPEPVFGPAISRRKQSRPKEALAELEKQLRRFPGNFNVLFMKAEIQAQDLHDMTAARESVDRVLSQSKIKPGQVSMTLNALADWELNISRNRFAALEALQRLESLFPDSQIANEAAQRIARLPSQEAIDERVAGKVFKIKATPRDRLIRPEELQPPPSDPSVEERVQALRHQLAQYPKDASAREELARLYAGELRQLQPAVEHLNALIHLPGQPMRKVVHWLNLMADLQLQQGQDAGAARRTLDRIVRSFPNSAAAQQASERIEMLGRELKSIKEKSRAVPLGSYPKDLGLKGNDSRIN